MINPIILCLVFVTIFLACGYLAARFNRRVKQAHAKPANAPVPVEFVIRPEKPARIDAEPISFPKFVDTSSKRAVATKENRRTAKPPVRRMEEINHNKAIIVSRSGRPMVVKIEHYLRDDIFTLRRPRGGPIFYGSLQ